MMNSKRCMKDVHERYTIAWFLYYKANQLTINIYKTFSKGSKPKLKTIAKIMHSFGVKLQSV